MRPEDIAIASEICNHLNDADYILQHLSNLPEPRLNVADQFLGFFTTNLFKNVGIAGWLSTGCSAGGIGRPWRDAQHSTDGFWTIDVEIVRLSVRDHKHTAQMASSFGAGKYLRLEVKPDTRAHRVCAERPPTTSDVIYFSGPMFIDHHSFYECHPADLSFANAPGTSGDASRA